ncbi:ATP synthase F1 subunit delta [bacterium]|nr:ATP synthase F1 subunit delta [bacterium]
MSHSKVSHRYAEAILNAIPQGMDIESVLGDLRDVQASIAASHELQLFFESPVIASKKKAEAVRALFENHVSGYVLSVLLLLVEKGREDIVLPIIEAVHDQRRQREGIIRTEVRSAVALGDDQRAQLVEALAGASGKHIEAVYEQDEALMGGLQVRLGDTVYDGSVQHQLERLRKRFISGR